MGRGGALRYCPAVISRNALGNKAGSAFFLGVFGGCGVLMLAAALLRRNVEAGLIVSGAISIAVGLFGAAALGLYHRYAPPSDRRFRSRGRPGMARILDITRTGLAERNAGYDIGIAFDLLVHLPEREAYEVTNHRQMVPDIHIPAIQPGMSVRVFVHPDKDDELIIDFSR
jgi:hypothetical protein